MRMAITMRAVVVNQAGGPEVLQIEERPIPEATEDQTVMRIHAFSVHRYEVLTRAGGSPSVHFPRVIGIEAVGEVHQPAKNSKFKKGQKVFTISGGFGREFDGSYQDYALVPDDQLYSVKFDGPWEKFANYPETFYTAYGALKSTKVTKGQSLLVRGGTTGVGMAAIVLANAMGIKVTATTRQASRLQELKDLGAEDSVLDTDGKLSTDSSFDGVVDMVGSIAIEDTLSHLKRGGIESVVGMLSGEWIWNDFDPFENLGGKYVTAFDGVVYPDWIQEMFALINQYNLEIPISKVFKLEDIQAAHEYVMKKERPVGQVIVTTD